MILAFGASSRAVKRDQHRAVVVVGRDDDRFRVLGAGEPQHLGFGGVAVHGDQARALRAFEHCGVLVDDDDVRGCHLVADHRGDRRPALGAVSDDDGVVAHSAPPSLDLQCLARVGGQCFHRGTDQDDQERDPQRRDHQDVDQPGLGAERGDVAVAGGRQRYGRVVQAVQERQLVLLHVAVAVAVQVHDEHRREQGQGRVDDATDDPLGRADERFGNAQDVDERGIRSRCQVLVDRLEPASQPTFSHENSSSIRVGARHYVTMTSPPPELQQIASPAPAHRLRRSCSAGCRYTF